MREPERCYNWLTGKFKEHKYIGTASAEMNLQINATLGHYLHSSPLHFYCIKGSFGQKLFTLLSVFYNLGL